jgi:sirohydrochlorin ferrochelatase
MSFEVSPAYVVVLAGHGSRSAEANASLVVLARGLAADVGVQVVAAYLEMAEPSIPVALREAADAGARRIVLVPYFLSPGMHVRRDLTEIVATARQELGIPIEIADFFGSHPEVPRLLAALTRSALGDERRDTAAHGTAGDIEDIPT